MRLKLNINPFKYIIYNYLCLFVCFLNFNIFIIFALNSYLHLMKYNLKFVLRTQKRKDNGLCPVVLRIHLPHKAGTKYEYLTTSVWLAEHQWDKAKESVLSHPEKQALNSGLLNYKNKVNMALHNSIMSGNATPENIKSLLETAGGPEFFEYARQVIQSMNSTNSVTKKKYLAHLSGFELFLGKKSYSLQRITTDLLKKYIAHLKSKGTKPSTMVAHMVVLKMVLRHAENRGLIGSKQIQSNELKIVRKSDIHNIKFLTEQQLKAICLLPVNPNPHLQANIDLFVFSALTGGLRLSDMLDLRWEHFKVDAAGMVLLQKNIIKMGRKNYPLVVGSKALSILNKYGALGQSKGYVFHTILGINQANYESGELGRSYETQKYGGKCNGFLGRLSKKLGLEYKLHFHCARHTFATMALRSLPIEIVSKILGHSSIKMTERYAKVLEQDAIAGQEQFLRRVSGLFGD